MLQPEDLKAIAYLIDKIGLTELRKGILWAYSNNQYFLRTFSVHYPECYHALTCDMRDLPKLINHQSIYTPIIARYRLEHNR